MEFKNAKYYYDKKMIKLP